MRRIIGPDVSFYQDDPGTPQEINFVRMNQTTDFVIIRAGQNLWMDSDFKNNWRRAQEAGLPRGSYWFYDSRADPRQQAELWVNLLAGDFGELPLFADLEEAYGGTFTGWQHWKTFLERLRALVGQKEIGIYTAYYYWINNAPNPVTQPNELEYFHRYPLWIANYGVPQPLVPKPWASNEWLFWQFTASGDGPFYGVESLEIDLNYFNGDAQAFARRFNVPVPEDPIPPDPMGTRYRVNAGSLYVREGPGTNFKAIGYLLRNDVVESIGSNADGSWLRIRRISDELTGWASSAYLVRIGEPPPPPPPPTQDLYRVTARSLYVREGPGTNFKSVGYLLRDDVVEALEFNADQSWIRIRRTTDGLTGWSSSTYLEKIGTEPPPPPPPPPTGDRYRVTAGTLYVREGPGTNFKSVGFLRRNDEVEALEANADGSWLRIRRPTDGLTGWSSSTYLEKITTTPPPPPPPPTGDRYRVTATRLHVREGPGTSFPSIGYLNLNEVVTAIGVNEDKTWRQIRRSDGLTGWSSAAYLSYFPPAPPPDPNDPPPDEVTGNWYRVTGKLNVREGPGTSFKAVGALSKDEAVKALSANDDKSWIRFRRVDGLDAWASISFLTNLGKTPDTIMQKIFKGVTYYRHERMSPRRLISHVLKIDMRSEGLGFLVRPPVRDTFPHLCTQTGSEFLQEYDLQIVINGDAFYYLDPAEYPPQDYCPDGGEPGRLLGYAASRGKVYHAHKEPSRPIVYINRNNEITIDMPKGKVYNAISGERPLVSKGKRVPGLDAEVLEPRTAFGLNQNSRWLYLAVVDGRDVSQGANYVELADLLISHGVYTGISFDSGGSATMVIEGVDGHPRLLNTPVNEKGVGRERAIASHLGIFVNK